MARYFLHQRGGEREFSDEEGQDLADLDAARATAVAGIRSILSDEVLRGALPLGERVDIEDAAGHQLASVRFIEAVELRTEVRG
ncbi:MAG TPA: hypothetical protein VGB62_09420 [Allosphingosinicella sp.]|jgi:hypothetical protein